MKARRRTREVSFRVTFNLALTRSIPPEPSLAQRRIRWWLRWQNTPRATCTLLRHSPRWRPRRGDRKDGRKEGERKGRPVEWAGRKEQWGMSERREEGKKEAIRSSVSRWLLHHLCRGMMVQPSSVSHSSGHVADVWWFLKDWRLQV